MESIAARIAQLDTWLDSIRNEDGYGGPVVHWWQNSLHYTGAALDWRYEGIVTAYLNLYQKTKAQQWLHKAQRAGDDLVKGQLPSGNFRFSSFEQNPHAGGTPHEAACDIALLRLAKQLRHDAQDATVYIEAARHNIDHYYVNTLWNPSEQYFQDTPSGTNIVPNKAATLTEALFLLAELTGEARYIDAYAMPTLHAVLKHQIKADTPLDGAIYQLSRNGHNSPWLFPYYAARCVPALVTAGQHTNDDRFIESAKAAMRFVSRFTYNDGSIAQIVYTNGQVNRYPSWVAANGDMLQCFDMLAPYELLVDTSASKEWVLQRQHTNGPFHTAYGFDSQVSQHSPKNKLPDLRDILPVVGWTDKAFRYLTTLYDGQEAIPVHKSAQSAISIESLLRGHRVQYNEDRNQVVILQGNRTIYRWYKGERWAAIDNKQLLWK